MSVSRADRHTAPIRTFGVQEPAEDDQDAVHDSSPILRRVWSRLSLSKKHRPSMSSQMDENAVQHEHGRSLSFSSERVPIPSVRQSSAEVYATPLPIVSMIVLSIVRIILYPRY